MYSLRNSTLSGLLLMTASTEDGAKEIQRKMERHDFKRTPRPGK
jgi:hypothetical protein